MSGKINYALVLTVVAGLLAQAAPLTVYGGPTYDSLTETGYKIPSCAARASTTPVRPWETPESTTPAEVNRIDADTEYIAS